MTKRTLTLRQRLRSVWLILTCTPVDIAIEMQGFNPAHAPEGYPPTDAYLTRLYDRTIMNSRKDLDPTNPTLGEHADALHRIYLDGVRMGKRIAAGEPHG